MRYQQVNKGQKNATIAKCYQIKVEDKWKCLTNNFTSICTILRSSNNYSNDFLGVLDFGDGIELKKIDECVQALFST